MKPEGPDTRESRRMATLLEMSQALSGTLNLKSSLQRLLEILAKGHSAVRGVVTLLTEDGDLVIEAADGLDLPVRNVRYRMGEGITGRVVESSKPVVVPRVSREPDFLHPAVRRAERSREEISFVCVPILINRKAVGPLGVDWRCKAGPDFDSHVKFLGAVASITPQALKLQRAGAD